MIKRILSAINGTSRTILGDTPAVISGYQPTIGKALPESIQGIKALRAQEKGRDFMGVDYRVWLREGRVTLDQLRQKHLTLGLQWLVSAFFFGLSLGGLFSAASDFNARVWWFGILVLTSAAMPLFAWRCFNLRNLHSVSWPSFASRLRASPALLLPLSQEFPSRP